MDAIQQSVAQLQLLFDQRMNAYQMDLQAAAPTANVTSLASEFAGFRDFIMTAVRCLQDQVELLRQQQDSMEMRSRRKILLLHGLAEEKDEVTAAVVAKAVCTQLKIPNFTVKDISRCHRMGRKASPDKPRPILLKVCSSEHRNKIWFAKASLKGSGVTISEFLTKSRHETFMMARQRFGIQKCWTSNGFVFVQGADEKRHRISSLAELERIEVSVTPKTASVAAKEPAAAPKTRRAAARK